MTLTTTRMDSTSTGDPTRFLGLGQLKSGLDAMAPPPADAGHVTLLVRRGSGGLRELPARLELAVDLGVEGDAWGRKAERNPQMQIAVMHSGVAALVANGQSLALFGDSLFLDLDLSTDNLPAGSRLRVGTALLEVTPEPHNGCRKFQARFGPDALRFVSAKELRHRNLRGIYMRVVEPGGVRTGDRVTVLAREAK
jgi:MOSC domain-containing protein YiiM